MDIFLREDCLRMLDIYKDFPSCCSSLTSLCALFQYSFPIQAIRLGICLTLHGVFCQIAIVCKGIGEKWEISPFQLKVLPERDDLPIFTDTFLWASPRGCMIAEALADSDEKRGALQLLLIEHRSMMLRNLWRDMRVSARYRCLIVYGRHANLLSLYAYHF